MPRSWLSRGAVAEAAQGQVVVSVKACGVNFPDTLIIQGKYQFQAGATVLAWRRKSPASSRKLERVCPGSSPAIGDRVQYLGRIRRGKCG